MSRTSPRPLDCSRVRELFDYNEDTGLLQWKVPTSNRVNVGDYVTSTHSARYIQVGVDGARRLAHHVIWVFVYGEMPKGDVDHINRNRADNRLSNLRCIDRSENLLNAEHKSQFGHPGVISTPSGRFSVGIHIKRVRTYVGTYSTIDEAAAAYATRHVQLYGVKSRFHPEHPNARAKTAVSQ